MDQCGAFTAPSFVYNMLGTASYLEKNKGL